jgi:hypothetical protein
MTGYAREQFGAPWVDVDGNGCDTRDDILARDLTGVSYARDTTRCVVEAGVLADPYTGRTIHFLRGPGDLVDIDHVVALGNAWVTGAARWALATRTRFANDPMNLLAVDASANRQKGDGDTATWLPHHKSFRCRYAARQVSVKARYALWVTPPERRAITTVLARCPVEPVLPGPRVAVGRPQHTAPARSPRHASTDSAAKAGAAAGASYQNCDAARAAGAAPVHRGDAGYAPHLDRDGDGTGCE